MTVTKKRKPSIRLPDKPSELIDVALADLRKAEKDGCMIDMGEWHVPFDGSCSVCAAGAVMRRGVSDNLEVGPSYFNETTDNKLCAIDQLRVGFVYEALVMLEIPRAGVVVKNCEITHYDYDRTKFYRDLRRLAARLRKAGL